MGRPKGSKNKNVETPATGTPSAPPAAPAKTYSEAFKGMSFGQSTKDSQEVFQIRLLKPDVLIHNKNVLEYFSLSKHGRFFFGLHRQDKDLIASFHSEKAREDFLEQKVLKIGKAEVHVAPYPYEKPATKGAKFIISGVPMQATGTGVQKVLHPFGVDRFMFEKYSGTNVRTDRVIFWTTEKVPTSIYILGVKVCIKQVGLPTAPANSPVSVPKDPKEQKGEKVSETPQTPTHQAQKQAVNLAEGITPKRKDISPLSHPSKQAKTRLDSEAPPFSADLIRELGLPIPTQNSVLSVYEDVNDKTASEQNKELPSPLGKSKTKVTRPHEITGDTQDWFVLNQPDGSCDDDTIFKYEGSYTNETSTRHYAGMRWVQRVVHDGVYIIVLFKSRIYRYRQINQI